jgi:predicted Zn-dependent protease
MQILQISFICFLVALVGCATSPTGRQQLTIIPDSQMNQMGLDAFQEMKSNIPIEKDPRINAYVTCVASAVAKEAQGLGMPVKNWEIVVFKDKSANAFALPGGKIGVHTGILSVANTPGQLAAVLGHEVGHVIAKHSNERASRALLASGALEFINLSTADSKYHNEMMAALGLGAQFGVILPHGRKQESESDAIGLKLMAKAGFNPQDSVQLWKNMANASGGAPPEWMSTHPSHNTRIRELEKTIPNEIPEYQNALKNKKSPGCVQ